MFHFAAEKLFWGALGDVDFYNVLGSLDELDDVDDLLAQRDGGDDGEHEEGAIVGEEGDFVGETEEVEGVSEEPKRLVSEAHEAEEVFVVVVNLQNSKVIFVDDFVRGDAAYERRVEVAKVGGDIEGDDESEKGNEAGIKVGEYS